MSEPERTNRLNKRQRVPMELLFFVLFVVAYLALQLVILPKLGVPT